MCGISAWLKLRPSSGSTGASSTDQRHDVTDLVRSLDILHHRGPDARGAWLSDDQCVGLGSVRLAIQDLTPAGDQPLHDAASDVHVVVNGEIYSYQKLRAQLETTHVFQSFSDSELIIAAYNFYGLSFLSHLRGEFALCLYDAKRKLFVAARDRFGIKPLYWTRIGDRLHFASEAKAFLPFGWRPEWDVRSIVEDGWLHDERTLFRGVNKVRAGHYMTCISFEHIEQEAYWDISYPNKYHRDIRSEEEMIQGLRDHLIDAVSERLKADAKIGLYLSGGLDSAVIAGVAKEIYDRGVKRGDAGTPLTPPPCFCVGFEENTEFDEMPIAQRTAESLGFPFFSRRMDENSLVDMFEEATYHAEVLNPDLNTVAKFALSKLAHENGVKVVLSGEGSDELFGGYPCFFPDFLREPDYSVADDQLDSTTRRELTNKAEVKVSAGFKGIDRSRTTLASERAKRMTNNLSITSCLWTVTLAHFAPWTKGLGCVSIEETRANNPSVHALQRLNNEWHPLHGAEYIWSRSILPNWILTCMGDRMEMGHSVEGRPPFLDHQLAEYVNNLPPSMKIKYDAKSDTVTEKWILREATRPWITDEVYRRTKHPFSAPYLYKAGGPMHKLLTRLVTRETLEQLGFVDIGKTLQTLDDAFSGHDPQGIRYCFIVAQLVTLSQQLGIATAHPPDVAQDRQFRSRPAVQASL